MKEKTKVVKTVKDLMAEIWSEIWDNPVVDCGEGQWAVEDNGRVMLVLDTLCSTDIIGGIEIPRCLDDLSCLDERSNGTGAPKENLYAGIYWIGNRLALWVDDQYDPYLALCDKDKTATPESLLYDAILNWEHDEPDEIWMANWGYDEMLDEMVVDDDYPGKVRIVEEKSYYGPTKNIHYITLGTDEPYIWDTVADAKRWLEENTEGTYYLEHNESGRPCHRIVRE